MTLLKAQGIRGLVGKKRLAAVHRRRGEIYEQEELDKLFAESDAEEWLWCEFFLITGTREQEGMYTYWSGINLMAGTVRAGQKGSNLRTGPDIPFSAPKLVASHSYL